MYRMGEVQFGNDSGRTLKRAHVAAGGLCTKTKPYMWYLPWLHSLEEAAGGVDDPLSDTEAL